MTSRLLDVHRSVKILPLNPWHLDHSCVLRRDPLLAAAVVATVGKSDEIHRG